MHNSPLFFSSLASGEVVADEESNEEDNREETVTPPSSFIRSAPHSPSPDPAHDT